jgi:hypothetical protein
MEQYMLSTTDNPYNPFTQWREWYVWDEAHGYHTSSLLARVVMMSDDLSDAQQESLINQGIDEVVFENVSGKHIKVKQH